MLPSIHVRTRPTSPGRNAVTTPPATEVSDASELRHQLVEQLRADNHIRTAAVERAFRTVPRHVFAPDVAAEAAYANDIIPTRHAPDGRVISSVSAPWLQDDMLEATRMRPGHRVLEIGSGGYNAALMAELVGPAGHVTTLDIDPAVTDRTTRFLTENGYDHVRVVTADAEHLPTGVVPDGGFDAVVVTVDTWDLPWIDALAEGGRLIAPLRLHGYHWAIGFTKDEGTAQRRAAHRLRLRRHAGRRRLADEPPHRPGHRRPPVLGRRHPAARRPTRPSPRPRADRHPHRYHRPRSGTLRPPHPLPRRRPTRLLPPGGRPRRRQRSPEPAAPPLARRRDRPRVLPRPAGHRTHRRRGRRQGPVRIHRPRLWRPRTSRRAGDGRAGQALAAQSPRPRCPLITARPAAGCAPAGADHEPHVFAKKHTRITVDWPIVPSSTALLTAPEGGSAG
ncbi:methyltransferase domain-containing protein [Streptomyces sp. NPDC054834]